MLGYTYQSFHIITIEFDEYNSYCDEYNWCWKKVVDKENAEYVTKKFKIIEIEDLKYNKYNTIDKYLISRDCIVSKNGIYSINNIYEEKIHFWLNKQIAFNKKIRNSRDYKKLATPGGSNPIYIFHNSCVPLYEEYLPTFFSDIKGISGMYKQYYPDGVLEKECYHNSDKYEGEHKAYYMNGKIKEITTYVNGKRIGKNIEYYDNGDFIHRNYIDENKYEVIEYLKN